MIQQPTVTLVEQAASKIEQEFPDRHTGSTRVVWWDSGGFLRNVVEKAADELGVGFRPAKRFPLELRIEAVEEERETDRPIVWYVGEAKCDRDWFRDITETGGEIRCGIEELTAELYEVTPWRIFDVELFDEEARAEAAEVIQSRFSSSGIPQYEKLREEIITKGSGLILDHLLREGWPEISTDEVTVGQVRERLRDRHDVPIPEDAGPEQITTTVRRWAVAQALIQSGMASDRFPTDFAGSGHSPLMEILRMGGGRVSSDQYLGERYWPDVIGALEDVWAYSACPVDGALDVALFEAWQAAFEAGDLEQCASRANERAETLSTYHHETAWVGYWTQAEHLSRLEGYLQQWEDQDRISDPFEQYADPDEGSWRIDNEVLQLHLTRTPEEDLPGDHPAEAWLPDRRRELLIDRYRAYLSDLAESLEAALQVGSPLAGHRPAFEWWSDHKDDFDALGNVAIFFIDALRFDLAQRLKQRLSSSYEVKPETRIATLPTETKFGMASLTPGRSFRFSVRMADGTLTATKGQRPLSNKRQRVSFLQEEGWEVPTEEDDGWELQRIAYFDKEIDDVGEGDIGDVERHFSDYIDDLAALIQRKLDDENWDRIYVVTDHGFVLLPDETTMENVDTDALDGEVKYRRVAGDDLDGSGPGVHLPPETHGLDYLNTHLQVLVDPRQYFSKQGQTKSHYYHGGLLPQECVLSFLTIQK